MMNYLTFDVTPGCKDVISQGDKRPLDDTGEKFGVDTPSAERKEFLRIVRKIYDDYGIPVPVTFRYRTKDGEYKIGTLNKSRVTGLCGAKVLTPVKVGNSIIAVIPKMDKPV